MKSHIYKFHGINACRGCGKVETISAIKAYLNKFGVRGISITTIYGNRREVQGADDTRLLQGRIGWPSDYDYKQYMMKNCLK